MPQGRKGLSVEERVRARMRMKMISIFSIIKRLINSIMGKLSSLTSAMKIHEIYIGTDLSFKIKNLPSDPFFKGFDIKESRRKSSVVPALRNDDTVDMETV